MTFASRTQFHVERPWGQRPCLNSVLNVKALVGAFNQEKALVGIGALTKRALRARARYLNVNLARRNRDLQPGGTEIESLEEKSDSL